MKRYFFILIFSLLQFIAGSGNKLYAQSTTSSCACSCLKPLFDYLVASRRLFIKQTDHITVSTLVRDANRAGFRVSYTGCPILTKNINKYFYALTTTETGNSYKAMFGDCSIVLTTTNNASVSFYNLFTQSCDNTGSVYLAYNGIRQKRYFINRSISAYKVIHANDIFPELPAGYRYPYVITDTTTGSIYAADRNDSSYMAMTFFSADSIKSLPSNAKVISAGLHLFAKPEGYRPTTYPNAHTTLAGTNYGPSSSLLVCYDAWNYGMNFYRLLIVGQDFYTKIDLGFDAPDEDLVLDLTDRLITDIRALDYGFVLKYNDIGDSSLRYNTFCNQKYSDESKRPFIDVVYSVTGDSTIVAQLKIDSCYSCTEKSSTICYSAVTDTSVNPFTYGIAGNWRAYRSYAYYNDRSETDPSQYTNIRKYGTIKDYSDFWKLVDGAWQPQNTDSARWVWNSEITLHNRRGFELENKDPLGRFNTGLYGYDDALPTAVVQNARYREAAFEGFEDYYYGANPCDSACTTSRSFDFSSYKDNLDTTEQHTGRYSLRIAGNKSAGISANILADGGDDFSLAFNTANNNCSAGGVVLKGIKANKDVLLPGFSPLAGKKIVVSAWVKEAQDCKGESYVNNQINIIIARASSNIAIVAKPQGAIIEGWQRYEQVIELPADATVLTVNMQATGTGTVYFDDLRIHPYNANMKSFVYNPENLRLMAELDENNYATMYEYDDDGTLIRLKKETERGIKTITETRSALLKE
ncbi:hypothetical protein SAMN05518672_11216 [Chitinophaga sp. CF118]|uniref:hypothetical protein n=1 Tax=Chitinophaga sp. CF118 TaxID=1884367 RepID=UPI0008E15845|nr:hypothetical protein [Chitinophaga sp. CF118]SFE91026.1 hypothetical protein SAMN05518672_11216 [Chitinophaga sp. CF118]